MKNNIINLFKNQEKLSEKWILLIIFLFPIAGPVIRHWNSISLLLITFTALYFLFAKKDRYPLYTEEKIFLWAFFLFFCVFIVSGTINGWSEVQSKELGGELKFLLFIPIYLLIRENNYSKKALFAGVLLSVPVIFLYSVYEYFYILPYVPRPNLYGAYFHLFIGPITAFSLLMTYHAYKVWFENEKYYWLIPIYSFMGLFVIILSQARLAYLTIIGGAIVLVFLLMKNLKTKISSIALIVLIVISAYQVDTVKKRIDLGIADMSSYFNHSKPSRPGSLGSRLEVLLSAQYVFKERPFVGIGNGNYPEFIKKYVDKGLVSNVALNFGQAHNSFSEVLIIKGSIGLILLLMIFYYPVYIAWKNRKTSRVSFVTISTFSAGITIMSLGESMLINKSNGVSYLIFFSAVLFSSLIHDVKSKGE